MSTGFCKAGDQCKHAHDEEARQREEELRNEYFAALPDDSFGADELALRDALIAFLEAHETARTAQEALKKADIKKAWDAIKPTTFMLAITDWIDYRIGGELECQKCEESGREYVGLVGQLDDMIEKRKTKAAEEKERELKNRGEKRPGPTKKRGGAEKRGRLE